MKCKSIGSVVDRKLSFSFDGQPDLTFDASRVHSGLHIQAEMHGWEQRLRDSAAGCKSEVERRNAVNGLIEHYHSGSADWSMRRAAQPSPVIAAIAEKRGCTYAEAEAYVAEQMLGELTA